VGLGDGVGAVVATPAEAEAEAERTDSEKEAAVVGTGESVSRGETASFGPSGPDEPPSGASAFEPLDGERRAR